MKLPEDMHHTSCINDLLMPWLRIAACLFPIGMATAHAASTPGYPVRPIRILTGEPGGGNDFASRLIALHLTSAIGQHVIVENRPSTQVVQLVASAQADGYTLLLISDNMWIGPLIETLPYDPIKDFSPITLAISSPAVLIVHPSVPARSVKELIDLAKAKPGQLNYASSAIGTVTHLAAEMFKSMADVSIARVAYKGGTPGVNAVVAGEVQLMFITSAAIMPFVKSGRLRALAVTSAEPSPLVPGLATMASAGLPGYESVSMTGIFAPARVPAGVVNRLNHEIVGVLNKPDVKEKLASSGAEVIASSPQALAIAIKKDMTIKGKLIRDAAIRPDTGRN